MLNTLARGSLSKKICSADNSRLQSILAGKSRQKAEAANHSHSQEQRQEMHERLPSAHFLLFFFIHARNHTNRMLLPKMCILVSTIKMLLHRDAHRPICSRQSFTETLPRWFYVTSKLTLKMTVFSLLYSVRFLLSYLQTIYFYLFYLLIDCMWRGKFN